MKVFKFGGASVKDASGVKNVALILQNYSKEPLVVVISAMGKTTNALEKVLNQFRAGQNYFQEIQHLYQYHETIMKGLFDQTDPVWQVVQDSFSALEKNLDAGAPYDRVYDQVVSWGEIISTQIVFHYLKKSGIRCRWIDARNVVHTDSTYREGTVLWKETCSAIHRLLPSLQQPEVIITQGFIGRSNEGLTTTLGRDGSDFSAAIFASCLNAESVTIWKDVPGVMNADPKRLPAATIFQELPFQEAAEMTYYGASVIHPKTIKPLANKGIPLYVKNFDDPSLAGTVIHECHIERLAPLVVFKDNQCLVSCKVTDYTFVTEDHLRRIFNVLSELNIHINVMQNSAISFSFCIDFDEQKLKPLITKLQQDFEVYYNTGLTLITVKNYDEQSFETYRKKPGILLEQSSRSTLQVLVKNQR